MAIVFISPKDRQNTFLKVAAIILAFVAVMALLVFLFFKFRSEVQNISSAPGAGNANLAIDFSVVDSAEVLGLDPFADVMMPFSYAGQDSKGKQVTGTVLAKDKESARQNLLLQGINTTSLAETTIGRNEPFAAYYPASK